MKGRWKDRVVVVAGASAGVGRATVRRFARGGARIGLLARDRERLRATADEVERLGGSALVLPIDVADADQVETAATTVERELGEIDVWINNAMVTVFGELVQLRPDEYRRVTDVTYHGTVWGTMAALRRMLARDRGRIVCVGSALAWRGIPLQAAYCGAKHAMLGMFESVRSELLHRGSAVTLSVVHLPALNTPQFTWMRNKRQRRPQPVPPIFQPEVAAAAVEHAAATGRRTTHVAFSTSRAIFGNRIAPALADHYLARHGYDSQLTPEEDDPQRPDNLFDPVRGEQLAARGRFDARARAHSPMTWMVRNARWLAPAAIAALTVGWGLTARARAR